MNNGDIWIAESAARLVHGAGLAARDGADDGAAAQQLAEAARLLERAAPRAAKCGTKGHPWASEIRAALGERHELTVAGPRSSAGTGADQASEAWLDALPKTDCFLVCAGT